jgi:hypothetical protein
MEGALSMSKTEEGGVLTEVFSKGVVGSDLFLSDVKKERGTRPSIPRSLAVYGFFRLASKFPKLRDDDSV